MGKYILALDQGTTSSRALILNNEGAIIGLAHREFSQIFPKSGWVEHRPDEIWSSQAAAIEMALSQANLALSNIAAIGITNQRETTIVWDRQSSRPIYNAIVWQDRRTTPLCEKLKAEGYEPLFRKKTGLLLDPYFSGSKLKWILDNLPDAKKMAAEGRLAFGTVDSWLLWKLTEGRIHATDATNASRTLLYNIHTQAWDQELLDIFDIPRSLLPEVRSSSEIYGECSGSLFTTSVPIAGIAGDQQAALFGQSCFEVGSGKITYGTGSFILINTGKNAINSSKGLLTSIAYRLGNETTYTLEGSVFIGGAAVAWLRDCLGIIKTSSEVEALAASTEDSGGTVFVPAFTGLGAPYWDPHARGMIMGLSRGTTAAHIARATLEGIAFQIAGLIDLIAEEIEINRLKVDGGASNNNLLMQLQADFLGLPLQRPHCKEVTACGAAFLAGLAVGCWKSPKEIQKLWNEEQLFTPALSNEQRQVRKDLWEKAVACVQLWGKHESR